MGLNLITTFGMLHLWNDAYIILFPTLGERLIIKALMNDQRFRKKYSVFTQVLLATRQDWKHSYFAVSVSPVNFALRNLLDFIAFAVFYQSIQLDFTQSWIRVTDFGKERMASCADTKVASIFSIRSSPTNRFSGHLLTAERYLRKSLSSRGQFFK